MHCVLHSMLTFNQTNVELKQIFTASTQRQKAAFNQTNVELKLVIESCIHKLPLLIRNRMP